MATTQQVENACNALWTTHDAAVRRAADEWLTAWQRSADAWGAALQLAQMGNSPDTRLFGATTLYNKLRCGGDRQLAAHEAVGLRAELLRLASAPGCEVRLRSKLCRATATLVGATASPSDSADGGKWPAPAPEHPTVSLLRAACEQGLPAPASLELVALVAEEGSGVHPEAEAMEMQARRPPPITPSSHPLHI
eukprot:scaffold3382_cov108-Isochrysis_galbana.AAC.1